MTNALLTAWVLFCLMLAASCLRCKQCYLNFPHIGCLPKATECVAKPGQMCVTIVFRNRGEVLYQIHGCTIRARSTCNRITKTAVPGESIIPLCCKSENFCNTL